MKFFFCLFSDEIDSESKEIFSDVMDEYCTIRGILSKLESWRETDRDAYMEAYVSLCIPKIISPIIRLQLLTWNPIMVLSLHQTYIYFSYKYNTGRVKYEL